jgi:agmatine/peptidylarginine deiminase
MPRLPAEWEPQAAVLLTWPHAQTPWAPELDRAEALWTDLAVLIARREPVLIVVRDPDHAAAVRRRLTPAGVPPDRLHLALAPSNDAWARDHGPVTVLGEAGEPELIDFRFNAWGAKYPFELDDRIPATLHAAGVFGQARLTRSALTLEGGAIETDGAGTLLAATRTLVDPARNAGWERNTCQAELAQRLGFRRFLWLRHGYLSGDDTGGHIDTLVRFCTPDTLCHVQGTDTGDPDYAGLVDMGRELAALTQASGRPYRLAPLPSPRPILDQVDGHRLPAGYANFLILNGALLMPVYGDPADQIAAARLKDLFPGRELLTLDCRLLIRQGGSLHCITMQLPAAVRLGPRGSEGTPGSA